MYSTSRIYLFKESLDVCRKCWLKKVYTSNIFYNDGIINNSILFIVHNYKALMHNFTAIPYKINK